MAIKQSLQQVYPRRFDVPLLIFTSLGLLIVGLSVPLMNVSKFHFWRNDYSVLAGVMSLLKDGQYILSFILFFFSVAFPIAKLIALALMWQVPFRDDKRRFVLKWIGILGKWSMLDVFVVAILIVLVKLGPIADITPQSGVYIFTAAILCTNITAFLVEHLASKSLKD